MTSKRPLWRFTGLSLIILAVSGCITFGLRAETIDAIGTAEKFENASRTLTDCNSMDTELANLRQLIQQLNLKVTAHFKAIIKNMAAYKKTPGTDSAGSTTAVKKTEPTKAPPKKAEIKKELPRGEVLHTTDQTYNADIVDTKQIVLIDLYADWCGPCQALKPVLEKIAKAHPDTVRIYKANGEENPMLMKNFGAKAYPTLLFFKNGKLVKQRVGYMNESQLLRLINDAGK